MIFQLAGGKLIPVVSLVQWVLPSVQVQIHVRWFDEGAAASEAGVESPLQDTRSLLIPHFINLAG